MEKMQILYAICLDKKNISTLIEVICEDVKLSERSVPKCIVMIQDIMKKNISRLTRAPRNKEEIKELVKHLNRLCIGTIIEIIAKRYPDLHINRRKQVSKEQMRRDLDVYGNREIHVQDRPFGRPKKQYDDDENEFKYSMKPNDIGYSANDSNGNFASAFGNHLLSNIPMNENQSLFNNETCQRGSSENSTNGGTNRDVNRYTNGDPNMMQDRMQQFVNDRAQQKMSRQAINDEQMGQKNLNSTADANSGMMSGIPVGMMPSNCDENLYASLLAPGAPGQNMSQNMNQGMGQNMNQNMSQNMAQVGPMGQGNPLMPMSTTNLMADQMGYNNMNTMQGGYGTGAESQSVKSMQLQNDFEKKIAERRLIDMETNQPPPKQSNQSSYDNHQMCGSIQMPDMMPTNGMGFGGMGTMNSNGMNGMNGMNMNGMNLNGMNMNNMNSNSMNMNGMNLNGMNFSGMNFSGMNMNGMNANGMTNMNSMQNMLSTM